MTFNLLFHLNFLSYSPFLHMTQFNSTLYHKNENFFIIFIYLLSHNPRTWGIIHSCHSTMPCHMSSRLSVFRIWRVYEWKIFYNCDNVKSLNFSLSLTSVFCLLCYAMWCERNKQKRGKFWWVKHFYVITQQMTLNFFFIFILSHKIFLFLLFYCLLLLLSSLVKQSKLIKMKTKHDKFCSMRMR